MGIRVTPSIDDKFRFVLDVDKHPRDQVDELKQFCDKLKDAGLFISNYCFEVWLWAHVEKLDKITSCNSKEMKAELGGLQTGNYPHCFMKKKLIEIAIKRCKDVDVSNFFPNEKSSKVYLLIEELLSHSFLNVEVKL